MCSTRTVAQIDSLEQVIRAMPESKRTVDWINNTVDSLWNYHPEAGEKLGVLAADIARRIQYIEGEAKAYNNIGTSFGRRGYFEDCLENLLKSLNLFTEVNDIRRMASLTINVAIVYSELDELEKALEYFKASLRHFKKVGDSLLISQSQMNLGNALMMNKQYDSALYYFNKELKYRSNKGDTYGTTMTYHNIGTVYIEKEAYNEALPHFLSAKNFLKKDTPEELKSHVYSGLGIGYLKTGNRPKGLIYLDSALFLAEKHNLKDHTLTILNYYKEFYSGIEQFESAYAYQKQAFELHEKIRGEKVLQETERLKVQFQTAEKERKLAQLEQQQAEERGIRNVILVSAVSVIIIIGLLLLSIHLKRKKDQQIAALKFKKLNDEIILKNKEISSYTLSFLQKNQLMEELKEKVNEIKKQSSTEISKELSRVNKIVDNTFRSDEEWKTFQLTFDQMHDGFFSELKKEFPDISNAELKLCALLRLNMNLKESAKVLGIASDSVKTARYRLRKKLGLNTEDNLIDFLIQFEQEAKV